MWAKLPAADWADPLPELRDGILRVTHGANKTGARAMIGASENAIPLVMGEAIQARAEIGRGASCWQTPLSTRVVFDVMYVHR